MINEQAPRSRELRVTGVSRSFAGVQALAGVSLFVQPGEVFGLIGPNGAGKSTLVNIISGYDMPDSGTVEVDGVDITRSKSFVRARDGLARTFQHGHLFDGLTVRENIEVTALGTGRSRKQAFSLADQLLEEFHLSDRADQPAGSLPHGVERRVGVARALATEPRYVLLDEPAAGLNEGEIGEFADNIRHLSSRGLGVLLIDHNVRLILNVCDRIHVLVEGKTLLEGTPDEVRASDELAEAYLGKSGRVSG
jgi:branched-chain amino acid transport system ATP-binding protein